MDDVVGLTARLGQHLQRGALGIAVLAVAGEHVVVGGDALEEVRRHVVLTAVVQPLEHVDVQRPAGFDQPDEFEALEHFVTPRIAGEQDAPTDAGLDLHLGEHHDARQVEHGVVVVAGERLHLVGVGPDPRVVLAAQLLDLGLHRPDHGELQTVSEVQRCAIGRRDDQPTVELEVQFGSQPSGVVAQRAALRHAGQHGVRGAGHVRRGRVQPVELGGRDLAVERGGTEPSVDRIGEIRPVVVDDVVEGVVPQVENRHQPRIALAVVDQFLGQLDESLHVVVVDVAQHAPVHR